MSGQPSRPASTEPLPGCRQSLGRSLWGQSPACSLGGSAMSVLEDTRGSAGCMERAGAAHIHPGTEHFLFFSSL